MTDLELAAGIRLLLLSQGFLRVGFARVTALEEEGHHLREWLREGHSADMDWMGRTEQVRRQVDHPRMLGGAQSVIAVAARCANGSLPDLKPGRVARYARGRDYHRVLQGWLRPALGMLRERGFEARASVDTLPVMERAWAQRAGIGFIGKNACLIVPGEGSHVLLGAIVTTAVLGESEPMGSRCGQCTACLEGCPTDAFVGPHRVDSRRCISYWTVESRDVPPEPLRSSMGDWVMGCDVCQDLCPFNQGRSSCLTEGSETDRVSPDGDRVRAWNRSTATQTETDGPAADRWSGLDATAVLQMDEPGFDRWSEGSPVRRPGLLGLQKNITVALGNHGNRRHLPILKSRANNARLPEPHRRLSQWATDRIRERDPQT